MNLRDLVIDAARQTPDALAAQASDGCLTYGALDQFANRFAQALANLGVGPGDRVGIWLEKSALAVAAMQGALRLNAIYVPLDSLNPTTRIGTIVQDCGIRALVTSRKRAEMMQIAGNGTRGLAYLCLDEDGPDQCWERFLALPGEMVPSHPTTEDEIAYILYTSGSTGKPKGVCISHRNALAFIEWAVATLQATAADRFANHAPFHFDLSVLDLYAAFSVGAAVLLIPDGVSFLPHALVSFIEREAPTVWYSVPSALVLMIEEGKLLERGTPSLRALLFAGEPFPIKYLRYLHEQWSGVRLLNLYGPTETNVCTYYEVMEIEKDRTRPVPIGKACSGDQVWAEKADGSVVKAGEKGELMVSGPTVMVGYWGRAAHSKQPYATGDIVQLQDDGNYLYIGRRDHMVKVRGHRIEPGDIEAALVEHPAIQEAAVQVEGSDTTARLVAFVVTSQQEAPSLLEMKRHCAERLPRYMIVDEVRVLPALPRTRNGKIDHLALTNTTR